MASSQLWGLAKLGHSEGGIKVLGVILKDGGNPWSRLTGSLLLPPAQFPTTLIHTQAKCPSPVLPPLTDALVHVGVAGIEVTGRAGGQADAHLADVVPLQQDEELG